MDIGISYTIVITPFVGSDSEWYNNNSDKKS